MKNKSITILLSIFGALLISPALAATYPTVAGITISGSTTAAEYVVYFFNLAIAMGAFIAAVVLVMAGVDFIGAGGDPTKISDAKGKIKNAFIGLLILVSSFMILNTINPQLTNIKIDQVGKTTQTEIVIPEGTGVYLYDSPSYVSTQKPLRITETTASFLDGNFINKAQSIKFVNPDTFKFGAVLFAATDDSSGADLRGDCSFALNNIPDLSTIMGEQNKPPVGNNNLASIVVFKTKDGSASATIYNSANCTKRNNDYEPQVDEENMCTINSSSGFANIKEACPKFKGDVVSIQPSGNVGVLLKVVEKEKPGRCQYLESNNSGCINTVKYSYAYKLNEDSYFPSVSPQSFMLFPLVK